jgi:hypothetical protein
MVIHAQHNVVFIKTKFRRKLHNKDKSRSLRLISDILKTVLCIQTPPSKPYMKSQFATTMAKSGFRDIIMGKTQEDRSVYDVTMLMDTLNDKQKKYASVWANSTKGVENN